MGQKIRINTYKSMTTKIIAGVAAFGIIIAMGVVVLMKATEPISMEHTEFVWFKIEGNENVTSVQASVYIYDDNNTFLETFMFFNDTGWQSSISTYELGRVLNIFVDFWFIDETIDVLTYRIVSPPIVVNYDTVSITIVSSAEVPIF